MTAEVTASHRGGSGEPLVLLHGFTDTWRTWELVLPTLERHFDVFAPTLLGHHGGPELSGQFEPDALVDALERTLDDAGIGTAYVAGNSLGGFAALRLAERGRARAVVAFAPAGGWEVGDETSEERLAFFRELQPLAKAAAPHADALAATPEGRRRMTEFVTVNYEHIPPELLAAQLRGVANCPAALPFIDAASSFDWSTGPISCPVRVVWGTEDRILPWPPAAVRYREESLPDADWVVLEHVGHCPQLDVPERATQLIVEWLSDSD